MLNLSKARAMCKVHDTDGMKRFIEQAIQSREYLDSADNQGFTLLIRSAKYGMLEAARMLLDAGADIAAKDRNGHTALMQAARNGNADVAKLLIERGADVNDVDYDGCSALSLAAKGKWGYLCSLLIMAGADPANAKGASSYAVYKKDIKKARAEEEAETSPDADFEL